MNLFRFNHSFSSDFFIVCIFKYRITVLFNVRWFEWKICLLLFLQYYLCTKYTADNYYDYDYDDNCYLHSIKGDTNSLGETEYYRNCLWHGLSHEDWLRAANKEQLKLLCIWLLWTNETKPSRTRYQTLYIRVACAPVDLVLQLRWWSQPLFIRAVTSHSRPSLFFSFLYGWLDLVPWQTPGERNQADLFDLKWQPWQKVFRPTAISSPQLC